MQPPTRSGCPSPDELEIIAAGEDFADSQSALRHIEECGDCRAALGHIREENALIREFAASRTTSSLSRRISGEFPRIEGYEFTCEIHRGGQGVVYKAVQRSTKRVVAVKTLAPRSGVNAKHRRRFEREIEVVAQLRHPNIVTLYDSGVASAGRHYLVMEFVQGLRLDEYLRNQPALSMESRIRLFATICAAVQFAHQRGVIHRDIKPANILVDAAGAPHVLDFGLAKAVGSEFSVETYTVTHGGEFLGTLAYASPEQVRADPERVDIRSDVYSLGVVLYEMLTGTLPYPVEGALSDVVRSITDAQPTAPSMLCGEIDNDLETIVLKALAKDVQRRYQTVDSLHRDLLHYLAGEPIDAKRDSTWYVLRKTLRQYRRTAMITAGFVTLLALFAASMFVQSRRLAAERDRLEQTNRALQLGEARQALIAENYEVAEDAFWRVHLRAAPDRSNTISGLDGKPGPIDAYWGLWELYSRQPCVRSWQAHPGSVVCAVSPDGATLATAGTDPSVKLWEVATGRMIDSFPGATVTMLQFLPDGRRLIWGDTKGQIGIWNLVDRRMEIDRLVHGDQIAHIVVHPDGAAVLVAGKITGVRLLGLPDLEDLNTPPDMTQWIDADFAWDGAFAASLLRDGAIELWTWPQLSLYDRLPSCPSFVFHPLQQWPSLRIRPDGGAIAVSFRGQIALLDSSARTYSTQHVTQLMVGGMGYDARGRLTVCDGRQLTIFPPSDSQGGVTRFWHRQFREFAWVPGTSLIAVGNYDGAVALWDTKPDAGVDSVSSSFHTVHSAALDPGGELIAFSGGLGRATAPAPTPIRLWDLREGGPAGDLEGHTNVVASLAFDASGTRLVSGSYDKTVRLWDVNARRCLLTLAAHDGDVGAVAFSPDGRYLASGGDDIKVRLWNATSGEMVQTFEGHETRVPMLRFSPDGNLLASCSASGDPNRILLHDLKAGKSAVLYDSDSGIRALAFSPDGQLLASGGDDYKIRLWDVAERTLLAEWETPPYHIFTLEFHPAGRLLASAGRGKDITLWDTQNQSSPYLATLHGKDHELVFSLQFHPDGRRLIVGGTSPAVRIYDLTHYDRHIAGNRDYQAHRLSSLPAVE